MIKLFKNNYWLWIIFGVFIFTRFLGLDQIYHQDEYRWATITNPAFAVEGWLDPHPPLARWLLQGGGLLWGFDRLRLVPFLVSLFNLFLIYGLAKKVSGQITVGLWAAGLFTASTYSLIANLQIDIDGAFLPFFILGSYYAFLHWREAEKFRRWWLMVLIAMFLGGLLTKLSFLLFLAAGLGEWFWAKWPGGGLKMAVKKNWQKLVLGVAILAIIVVYFLLANSGIIVKYAESFQVFNFSSRAYFDLIFKIFKSLVWLSPLLGGGLVVGLLKPTIRERYRLWYFYLALNLLFYLVVFDFTTRTIERYLMFSIVPAVLISAQALGDLSDRLDQQKAKPWWWISLFVFVFLAAVILWWPHATLPLNPKIAYWQKIRSFDFNFLIPFSGGSGPVGFYFSAGFILINWISGLTLWILIWRKRTFLFWALPVLLVWGLGYNVLMSAEYLTGKFFGSVPQIARQAVNYVLQNPEIEQVITYYDVGAYELNLDRKYHSRFYTAPRRDYTLKLSQFRGHYLIIDFPAIGSNNRYWPLITRCPLTKKFVDKNVRAFVADCAGLP